MKCYTIDNGSVSDGIYAVNGKIAVGERGRGRAQTLVPVPEGALTTNEYQRQWNGETQIQVTITDVPGPAGGALVLVKDQSGYRGHWEMVDGQEISILAEGRAAQGAAGAMGGGPEFLMLMQAGQYFVADRYGRLYGDPDLVRVENRNGLVCATDVRAEQREYEAKAALAAAIASDLEVEPEPTGEATATVTVYGDADEVAKFLKAAEKFAAKHGLKGGAV